MHFVEYVAHKCVHGDAVHLPTHAMICVSHVCVIRDVHVDTYCECGTQSFHNGHTCTSNSTRGLSVLRNLA